MKVGLFVPLVSPLCDRDFVAALGPAAEERGFDSLWAAEHLVLFDDYSSEYPYSPDGKIPAGGEVGIIEPFACLSFLAAITSRIRLGTGVLLVPQRNPVYTAKEAAAVDLLSGGRLDLGVGIGWLENEFEAAGVPFARRGKRTREYIEVIKKLWCEDPSSHDGEFYQLAECRHYPKPLQTPHPPIVFGGETDAALRRTADLGQGWYGYDHEPATAAERITKLTGLLAERGRSRQDIEISISPYMRQTGAREVEAFAEAGVDQLILYVLAGDRDELLGALDHVAVEVAELAHSL